MNIDVINSTLVLDVSSSKLKPRQVSQLKYWGFISESDGNKYRISLDHSKLIKLQNYLLKQGISYSLSPSCKEVISKINEGFAKTKNILTLGKEYKDGQYDKHLFDTFSAFTNQNIIRKLKEHQIKAAFHLYLVENGANFSVPGSGKTSVILSVFEKMKLERKVDVLFVIGPPACFGPWTLEFELTLGRKPDYRILAGGDKAQRKLEYYSSGQQIAELYLTTFQSLLNDKEDVKRLFKQSRGRVFLVVDEAHYIKQIGGSWANAVL